MKETEMLNHTDQDKPPQRTFIHYALKMTLDELNAFSDTLGVVQLSEYEVEKDTMTCLAILIHEKYQDFRGLMEEMTKGKRLFGLD